MFLKNVKRGQTFRGLLARTPSPSACPMKPGKVRLDNPTENTFTCEWDLVPGAKAYKLQVRCPTRPLTLPDQVREYPKDWSTAEVILVNDGTTKLTVVEGRFPTSTYQVRLVVVDASGTDSEPGDETTIDTAVGNCAPDAGSKKKCAVM